MEVKTPEGEEEGSQVKGLGIQKGEVTVVTRDLEGGNSGIQEEASG